MTAGVGPGNAAGKAVGDAGDAEDAEDVEDAARHHPRGPADDLTSDAAGEPTVKRTGDDVLRASGRQLAAGLEAAIPGWVVRSVGRRMREWAGEVPDGVAEDARRAGELARDEVVPRLRRLLDIDVDEQRTNPLSIVRGAARYPTEVLARAGVPAVVRDAFAERAFPDDRYDLTPSSFADVDPALTEPGIRWGAAKAHVVLTRRRAEGRR
jgi:hypothetical protein